MSLINNSNIDWNGNCRFDEKGEIIEFVHSSPNNHYGLKPVPKTDAVLKDAREAEKLLSSIMQPATKDQIAIAVKKLSLHCGMQAKAPEEVKSMFMDYCRDLAEYPKVLIDESCEIYRKQPDGNNFMPSSGKLISLINGKYHKMKFLRSRIEKILGTHEAIPERGNKSVSLMDAIKNLKGAK